MRPVLLAAGILAASIGFGAAGAAAADLKDDYTTYDRGASPYDDKRYADIYGSPKNAGRRYSEAPIYDGRRYREPVYKDRRYYDDSRRDRLRRHGEFDRHRRSYSQVCRRKAAIRRRLRSRGWRNFELLRARRHVAVLRARRANGDYYRLRVDRCSGDIVQARLIDRRYGDAYAFRLRRHRLAY